MTAVNLFVRSEAAYLLTDGAHYDGEGRVVQLQSKVASSQRHRMAITVSGFATPARLMAAIGDVGSQEDVLNGLPRALEAIRRENVGRLRGVTLAGEWPDAEHAAAFVALWSDAADEAQGWCCSTWQGPLGPDYPVRQVVGLDSFLMPTVGPPGWQERLDPARDGRALIEAQRRLPDDRHGGFCAIGGKAELTTVTREGVTQQIVCEWPDVVGERIAA